MTYTTRDTQDQIVGWTKDGVVIADRKRVKYVLVDSIWAVWSSGAKLDKWLKDNAK